MTSEQAIKEATRLSPLEKLKVYMDYFVDTMVVKYQTFGDIKGGFEHTSFSQFCSPDNVRINDAGENWKQNGFACQRWTVLTGPSIQRWAYLGITKRILNK